MVETVDATQRKEYCDIHHQENEAKAEEKVETDRDGLKMNDFEKTISEKLEAEGPESLYDNEATISQKPETDDAPKVDETEKPIPDARPLISPVQEKHVDKIRAPVQEQRLEQRAPAQTIRQHASLYGLPDGWIIEERPRNSPKYLGKSDKYFYEPRTLKLFRSLVAVQRHLQATGQPTESGQVINEHTLAASHQHGDQSLALQGSQMRSKKIPGRKRKDAPYFGFVFDNPPENARWALPLNDHKRVPPAGHDTQMIINKRPGHRTS